jgi:hypothetical protein
MKNLETLALALVAAIALMALTGAGNASAATTLEENGKAKSSSVSLEISLRTGTSLIVKDTNNIPVTTCTGSLIKASTAPPYHSSTVTAPVSGLTFTGCAHTTHVLKPGTLHFAHTSGTHGTISSSGAEVTIQSTVFGASCVAKTGTGTSIGTLTGATTLSEPGPHALIHINGVLPMGLCGDAVWTNTYLVTSPTDLGIVP